MLEIHFARIEAAPTGGDDVTIVPLTQTMRVLEYIPSPAAVSVTRTPGRRVGSRPVASTVDNVTETLSLRVSGDVPTAQRLLNQAFSMALEWSKQFRRDMRFVVRIRDPQRHQEWFEAELFNGRAEMERASGRVLRVTLEREPYWSGDEQILRLRNTVTQDYALSVFNHDDDQYGHDNFVIIDGPAGDVPTPARIRIRNTHVTNPGTRLKEVRIGWYDRPHYLTLEGEASEIPATIDYAAQYSNEARAMAQHYQWTLPQSNIVDYVGLFRVLAQGDLRGGTWTLSTGYELTKLQTSKAVTGLAGWTDLGLISLPPGGYVHPFRYPVRFWMDGSTAQTVNNHLDCLMFMPIQQWRHLKFEVGYNCAVGACLVDDGIRGELIYDFDGQALPIVTGWGDQIEVWPAGLLPGNQQQMLVFAMTDDFDRAEALRTADVQVTVRPRYSVLP
jgi:hypothetical protein